MPHIHIIILLSFRRSLSISLFQGPHVSLSCSNTERTQAVNSFPQIMSETCLEVRIWSTILNFHQAVLHLVIMMRLQPPLASNMSLR